MEERVDKKDGQTQDPAEGRLSDPAGDILKFFNAPKRDIRSFSPLELAFLGDNVFDLIIRTILAEKCNRPAGVLHKIKSGMVKASAQSEMADRIMPLLTDEETAVYKRGRNAKSHTVPKNADVTDYRKATGVEALIGYLYLEGRMERVLELTRAGMDRYEVLSSR